MWEAIEIQTKEDTGVEILVEIYRLQIISEGVNQLGGLTIDIISINNPVCLMFHFVLGTQAVRMGFVFFSGKEKVICCFFFWKKMNL